MTHDPPVEVLPPELGRPDPTQPQPLSSLLHIFAAMAGVPFSHVPQPPPAYCDGPTLDAETFEVCP